VIEEHGSRLAFVIVGDPDDPVGARSNPWGYSGAPQAIVESIRGMAIDVTPVSPDLPVAYQRLVTNLLAVGFSDPRRLVGSPQAIRMHVRASKPKVHASREMSQIRSSVLARRLKGLGPVDRFIQFGSEFRLPAGSDYITLDDATIVQLRRGYDYPWMREVGNRALARMTWRQQQIYLKARGCCFLNQWAARSAVDDYGVPPEKVHVVGTGSNHSFPSTARDWSVPRFLFVGKDFERKQGHRVIDGFRKVRRGCPGATLDLVGGHPALAEPGITGHGFLRLEHAEERALMHDLLARATCLVLPSLMEPTGNIHAEALAAGVGSIGTSRGGAATVIGDAGVTVDPLDQPGLEREMLRFCEPEVAREYGELARRRSPLFTWRAMAERIVRALELDGVDAEPLASFL
jgi:glycosyltransferase involved in cell wall biosynthesis